ncbi:DUF2497 domain-containing protein [Candidatus Liberibacter africanus]|uniref:Pole-organizing protein PopZ n=1 Tax=Candidatus Liberibacter africanus PTSAPSY TaxID=1277257 RepID=A0A0G3I7H0_LIBAF|nr:DUF2497 domain-containing protein [Candidatus Liberibacter africanus]AKK20473.1 hypothetical protein G293_04245 [Candidatus Liberibacter africanus PTSAPSY]QTP64188.1 DUF2497 domain-containing protein [Candidatus Liberibacter africanus]
MVQSTNAVSEPSMEEIVNSIRRILESNDQEFSSSNNVQTQVQERKEGVDENKDLMQEDKMSTRLFSDSNSRLRKYTVERPQQESVSLSDIAARVRSEARSDYPRASSDVSSPVEGLMPTKSVSEEDIIQDESLNEDISSNLDLNVQMKDPMHSSDVVDVCKEEDQAIISSDIENQVASSFDQLVKALKESDSRSLDQLSIDVLRPMLREWLDDNLPGIVERLVREEIERIARGPVRR